MHQYKVTVVLDTYSADPQEWISEVIQDQLEADETIKEVRVERIS